MLGCTILWFIINPNTYFRLPAVFWHLFSQSSVATYFRSGGIFKYGFVANLPMSLSVKNFENRLIFGEVMGKSLVSWFFLTHGVQWQQIGHQERRLSSAIACCNLYISARWSSCDFLTLCGMQTHLVTYLQLQRPWGEQPNVRVARGRVGSQWSRTRHWRKSTATLAEFTVSGTLHATFCAVHDLINIELFRWLRPQPKA